MTLTFSLIFPNYLDKCVGTWVRSETVAVPVKSGHVIETNYLTTGRASVFLAGPSASVARATRTQILVKTISYIGPCVRINYSQETRIISRYISFSLEYILHGNSISEEVPHDLP